jgi:hypothetical protein
MLWRIVGITIAGMQIDLPIIAANWSAVRRQSCILLLLLSGLLVVFLPRVTRPAVRAVRLVISGFGFSALWIVPCLLHHALLRQPIHRADLNHPSVFTSTSPNQRIVWILFDELSYDQVFDRTAPGVDLPNFNRLRAESVSSNNLKPSGFYTDRIIPSLLLGRRFDQIKSTVDGDLWYKDESQNQWLAYDPNATLFALAQQNGWSTGVDGWAIPYCRILAPVLNVCSSDPANLIIEGYGASEEKSMLTNAVLLPAAFLVEQVHGSAASTDAHLQSYRNLITRAQALIGNGQVRFVFLHLNVPHPHGIYDRKNHMLRTGGTYLDNLVLADDTLGVLLKAIYATPSASKTTVIVSSDHSWRIPLWRHDEFWSDEEERASGGRFDERPVLLIHFPGQNSENDVSSALPELLEHDIIAGMLLGQINNSENLVAFLTQHGS